MPTREEMITKIYQEIADKTLSFGCRVIDLNHQFFWKNDPIEMISLLSDIKYLKDDWINFLHYRWSPTIHLSEDEIMNSNNYKIIWHDVVI